MLPRPPQNFQSSPLHAAAAPRTRAPAGTTSKSTTHSPKSSPFLSTQAIVDTILLPVNTYVCLSEIEKRCGIYRVSPSLFASLVRLLAIDQPNGVVLNCMAREAVAKGTYRELCWALQAVDVTQKIPPFKDCTDKAREDFKTYLHSTTHLKTVFAFAEGGQLKKVLGISNLLQRVMKYLGKTDSRPKKVYLLENGLEGLVQLPLPITLLQMRVPCHVVVTARGASSIGISVISADKIRSGEDMKEVVEFCRRTQHSAIINISPKQLQLDRNCGLSVVQLGPDMLPLKSKEDAMRFHAAVYEQIVKLAESKVNFCFVDNPYKNLSALLIAMLLIDLGKQSAVDATNVVRTRLNPPEFDGYSMAALSHLGDMNEAPGVRRARALECLGERLVDNDTTNKEPQQSGSTSPSLLQGAQQLSLAEKWQEIESNLKKQPVPKLKLEEICSLIEGMFNRILTNPGEIKYRSIRSNNPRLVSVFGNYFVGPQILAAAGWQWRNTTYVLPQDARLQLLRDVLVYMASMRYF